MTQDGKDKKYPQPPAVVALKYESGVGPEPHKVMMERTFSQDIQEGTQELKEIAEQTRNIILDLSLDGIIRWVSPSWTDVVGSQLEMVKGQPIAKFIRDNPNIFEEAIAALKSNDSKSRFIRFAVETSPQDSLAPMLDRAASTSPKSNDDHTSDTSGRGTLLELEGQGIMVYDRATGGESHTMWMLQPATEPVHITISLPQSLVEKLGVGAEVLAKYLTELAEANANDPSSHPSPCPIVCRVCERSINPWWFEKHSDLCVQEHKAELEVSMIQESLTEHRHAIVKVLDAFEARNSRSSSAEASPSPSPEYKGMPIGPLPAQASGTSSGRISQTASPARSRSPSTSRGLGHARMRSSFIVRRPLVRVVELILDLCDTALEISTPAIKDNSGEDDDDVRTQSPKSESRVSQVLQWQQPSSLENEPGLSALSVDTEKLARAKLEAIHRYQVILEYAERIRQEYTAEVDDCITDALHKAEKAALGDLSSSDSDSEIQMDDLEEETPRADEPMFEALEPELSRRRSRPMLRSMVSALRNPMDIPVSFDESRRPSSQAVSTGSSSPMECPTPKSHKGNTLSQPQPISKRRSIYATDDGDSDSSLPPVLPGARRAESPASSSDHGLHRAASSRDGRKRRSMHLHNIGSASPHRQQSPGRYPPAPPSPLRMSKARMAGLEASLSPVASPLLNNHEFMASSPTLHHRRQSSIHSSDLRTPLSPRLNSIAQPQAKAQPPSIKDFEIIKPISKGAFGSVYLAKKKLTGEYFAVKVLRKSDMVAKNQVTNVKAERAIMMWQGESDFVAKLYWTFSSKEYLFLVMEYLNGGDCAALVKILGGLTEDWAKKYIAEVILGVEHLHDRGIVHRDLKPDNLLIDSKGHLKLTDFGLSRMGLIGRQKRALKTPSEDHGPDLLKQGPFTTHGSNPPSRSASFDYQGSNLSPAQSPLMTPALAGGLDQPSYFSLNRESSLSREVSRRTSGHRSDSGSMSTHDLHAAFKGMNLNDSGELRDSAASSRYGPIEEESMSHGSASPDMYPLSQSMSNISTAPASQMLPPPTALFDPEESNRRFVGTPDYLAPETVTGTVQDEMCDWWSMGCILFEFMYGFPPFNADSTDEVFDNILHRRIAWPNEEDDYCSEEAKDLINKLIQIDPRKRLGANADDKYPSGGAEIRAHPWFEGINWDTVLEAEAQFIPNPENPEDTEYFDTRGATLQAFPEEAEDSISPPASAIPVNTADYLDRPHDALFRARTQTISTKRGLMPLHIPPHVARDSRSRRLSEPVIADDFGNFTFKNLPVLERANKDIVEKMRKEAMQAQARGYSNSQAVSTSNTPVTGSPIASLESSPMLPMPVKRALSVNKGHRPASPSGLMGLNTTNNPSPARPSQPSSPLLVQFSTHAHHHERRKTSGSSAISVAQQGFFDLQKDPWGRDQQAPGTLANKGARGPAVSPARGLNLPAPRQSSAQGRSRSQTVGSHDSLDVAMSKETFVPGHHKRKSQLFVRDVSPSSSDNESVSAQAKALLKVQRKRQSSRRMSQINLLSGPAYRPLDILVCEDHPVSRMVMERLLERLRCRSITATTGPDALRLAVSTLQFDIIFLEYRLPLINGADVARMIRDTKSANTHTPIVCITGYLKELPESHHLDSLMLKPPTLDKLTDSLCKFCSWRPLANDSKHTAPLTIPAPMSRMERMPAQDSPSSVASSRAPTMPDSSWKGSSREDSIGSGGFFSDMESLKSDEIPVIISRAATDEWGHNGLGLPDEVISGPRSLAYSEQPGVMPREPSISSVMNEDSVDPTSTPRHQRAPSHEAIRNKRDILETKRASIGGPEEGDDEDEELGNAQARSRSPMGKVTRTASKLGHEMMRTNSRGSVISMNDERIVDSENLRRSLELLEGRMEELRILEEEPATSHTVQTRKSDARGLIQSVAELDPSQSNMQGHITPPVIFPQVPGSGAKEIESDDQVTPMPLRSINVEDQTPKPRASDSSHTV